ncbi:MAG: cytochrome d ubiquinol oxidase subunit II [Cellvibrionales bacterium]|nr:cytochrome d ubiquinol oxidase subunit II [Cellvibrionales bacterium]
MSDALLAEIFVGLMGLAVLVYAILDGYDLGVGILLPLDAHREVDRDRMIASIGPFWDANETWLVLAVGLLLIAFPKAHSLALYHLYLPTAFMLIGLILRGVAFDFRAKAHVDHKLGWDRTFKIGSILTALTQGYMLGLFVMGFDQSLPSIVFALVASFGVAAAFAYIGAAWLVWKAEGDLQKQAITWSKRAGRVAFIGVIAVCFVNLLVNPSVFAKWFEFPLVMFVLLIPSVCFCAFVLNEILLSRMPRQDDSYAWVSFLFVVTIFVCCFFGVAFSFFPDIVPGKMTIYESMSAPESLSFLLVGAVVVVPAIIGYTAFSYYVFRGKVNDLTYH